MISKSLEFRSGRQLKFDSSFRGDLNRSPVCRTITSPFISGVASGLRLPNKAPEPTSGSVTPRAMVVEADLKQLPVVRIAARGAPAPLVAHL
jgi:hypothetical protein